MSDSYVFVIGCAVEANSQEQADDLADEIAESLVRSGKVYAARAADAEPGTLNDLEELC